MKTMFRSIILLTILALMLPMEVGHVKAEPIDKDDFRGIWVATVLNIDYPSKASIKSETLKEEAIKILDHSQELGMTAVFLQVRPSGDALYKSEFFPWSKYLTGKQGQAPDEDFDPLEFWLNEAHKRGLELHAWINPYRVTKKTYNEAKHDLSSLDPENPAVKHPDWLVKHSDGNLYFNPGLAEVRKYIIDSVNEIIENYDIDGIHMDDYFYPGKNFNDIDTYKKYGKDFNNIDDWRRENVNILVKDLYESIKSHSKEISFGISPFGIWANKKSNSLGSETNGAQSYYEHYADTRKWVKEGIIDYIAPQIYWNMGFKVADYEKLAYWWADVVKDTDVDLYIGQAAYKVQKEDSKSPWYVDIEMKRQFNLNANIPEIKGSILYNYSSIAKMPELFSMIEEYNKRIDKEKEYTPIGVGVPEPGIKTKFSEYYICGSSDPQKPLWLNGKSVKARSSNGYYGVLVKLKDGENIFTFTQEKTSTSIAINKDSSSSTPIKTTAPTQENVILGKLPYYVEIKEENTYTYSSPNSGSGGIHELQKGMIDYITEIKGNYVRLSNGHWVNRSSVNVFTTKSKYNVKINKAEYTITDPWERLTLYTNESPLAVADFEDNELKLIVTGLKKGPLPRLPRDSIISEIRIKPEGNKGEYILKLKDNDSLAGYYIEKTKNGIVLNIRKKAKAKEGEYPLDGITIMLDPGHGGNSLGAVGPLGAQWSEKVINLNSSIKLKNELESLGAKVLMTRTEDIDVSLEDRLAMSKKAKPDLFVSIHANSMESNVDITKVDGFSIFYRDGYAYNIADKIHNQIVNILNRKDKGIRKEKFYVFRGTWCPSILIESGFVPNPVEFQWLIDEEEQDILVKNFAQAILEYYLE